MLPETKNHLAEHGFIRDDGEIATGKIIDQLRDLLTTQPVGTEDEIQQKGITIPELRKHVLGENNDEEVEAELDSRVRDLVSAGPNGRVQTSLANGYVLCGAPVMRPDDSGELTQKRRARFITSDPDLVEKYFQAPLIRRAVSSATTVNNGLELVSTRVPMLATKRWALAQNTHEQIAFQIPLGPA